MTLTRGFHREHRRGWVLIAAVLVYACALQGVQPIHSPDDGRHTDVALWILDARGYALLAGCSRDCAWRPGVNGLLPSR